MWFQPRHFNEYEYDSKEISLSKNISFTVRKKKEKRRKKKGKDKQFIPMFGCTLWNTYSFLCSKHIHSSFYQNQSTNVTAH